MKNKILFYIIFIFLLGISNSTYAYYDISVSIDDIEYSIDRYSGIAKISSISNDVI